MKIEGIRKIRETFSIEIIPKKEKFFFSIKDKIVAAAAVDIQICNILAHTWTETRSQYKEANITNKEMAINFT